MSNREKVKELFIDGEKKLAEISKILNITIERVRQLLKAEDIPIKKSCSTCGRTTYLRHFAKDSRKPFKRASQCKRCKNKRRRKKPRQSEIKDGKKYCKHCKEWFDVDSEHWYKRHKHQTLVCKLKQKGRSTQQIKKNPKKHREYVKKWVEKREKELGTTIGKHNVKNMANCYIAQTLRSRSGASHKFYVNDYEKFEELFEKQRSKLKLEREIREDVRR